MGKTSESKQTHQNGNAMGTEVVRNTELRQIHHGWRRDPYSLSSWEPAHRGGREVTCKASYLNLQGNIEECFVGVGSGFAAQARHWNAKRNAKQDGKETAPVHFNEPRTLLYMHTRHSVPH